jgi:hypothetical protein
MQHGNPTANKRAQRRQEWPAFSWRRMNSRHAWILLAVAAAFVLIGLAIV